ncbi:hypothetical protein ABPG75_010532 [Micractinium tetrahymenae]
MGESRRGMVPRRMLLVAAAVLHMAACAAPASARGLLADSLAGTAVVIAVDKQGEAPRRLLGVRTASRQHVEVRLRGPAYAQTAGLVTGTPIEVQGAWMHAVVSPGDPRPKSNYFAAGALQVTGPGPSPAAGDSGSVASTRAGGGAIAAAAASPSRPRLSFNQLVSKDVKAIFIPIAGVSSPGVSCPDTAPPLSTVAAVKKAVFEELSPRGVTVGGTYNRCSYNTSRLTMQNSLVAPLVELPCNGTTADNQTWSMSTCDYTDFTGYSDAADEVLRQRGIDLSAYKHRIYLLPPGPCTFVGLGYVGCDGSYDCRVWIGADFWTTPNAMVHEIGHNLYLGHAGAVTSAGVYDEYADLSGTMGYCCSDRCPNTPHAWQLGWITAQQIDGTAITPGQTLTFNINSQSVSRQTGLRVTLGTGTDPLFVGYRTKAGGDSGAPNSIVGFYKAPGRLHLHTAPIANTFDAQPTDWKGTLSAAGSAWAHPTAGLVVRLKSATATAAVVTLCRKAGPETMASCQAGLDNDCNGKVGSQDAACAALMSRAAALARPRRG